MSEPTKKQLTEAQKLGHDHGCLIEMDCTQEHGDAFSLTTESLALLIATVRTQATNDALERAAMRAWALLPEEHNFRIQAAIRAMKVLT